MYLIISYSKILHSLCQQYKHMLSSYQPPAGVVVMVAQWDLLPCHNLTVQTWKCGILLMTATVQKP